jgi:hypothetical protein
LGRSRRDSLCHCSNRFVALSYKCMRPLGTSIWRLKLLVCAAWRHWCMRLNLLVYEASSVREPKVWLLYWFTTGLLYSEIRACLVVRDQDFRVRLLETQVQLRPHTRVA